MTSTTTADPLLQYTDGIPGCPIPDALLAARRDPIYEALPSDEEEETGTPAELRARHSLRWPGQPPEPA